MEEFFRMFRQPPKAGGGSALGMTIFEFPDPPGYLKGTDHVVLASVADGRLREDDRFSKGKSKDGGGADHCEGN